MKNKKSLLAATTMAFVASMEMSKIELNDSHPRRCSKIALTKKQKKARVMAKIAKQSRKRNRK